MKNLKKILSIGLLLAISQLSIYPVKHLPRRLKLFRGYLNFITILLTLILFNGVVNCFAQNIGINQPNPDNSALLDMTSTERGLLIPRVTLTGTTDVATITGTEATGLLIYNTATAGDVTPGFYYWNGSAWKRTDTWQANTQAQNGYVLAGGANNNKVWKTDGSGNPDWRADDNGSTTTYTVGQSALGGVVFQVNSATPNTIGSSGTHGLVAATSDQSTGSTWYLTQDAISTYTTNNSVAMVYRDWRMPTKHELNLMYVLRTTIGGFSTTYYWSSSEKDDTYAWRQDFSNGNQVGGQKVFTCRVRAVRAF